MNRKRRRKPIIWNQSFFWE